MGIFGFANPVGGNTGSGIGSGMSAAQGSGSMALGMPGIAAGVAQMAKPGICPTCGQPLPASAGSGSMAPGIVGAGVAPGSLMAMSQPSAPAAPSQMTNGSSYGVGA